MINVKELYLFRNIKQYNILKTYFSLTIFVSLLLKLLLVNIGNI